MKNSICKHYHIIHYVNIHSYTIHKHFYCYYYSVFLVCVCFFCSFHSIFTFKHLTYQKFSTPHLLCAWCWSKYACKWILSQLIYLIRVCKCVRMFFFYVSYTSCFISIYILLLLLFFIYSSIYYSACFYFDSLVLVLWLLVSFACSCSLYVHRFIGVNISAWMYTPNALQFIGFLYFVFSLF